MNSMILSVGFESANGFVKTTSDLHTEVYRNTVREVNKALEMDLYNEKLGKTIFDIDDKVYEVGALQGARSSSGSSFDRYKSYAYKIESLIAIYKHIIRIDPSYYVKVVAVTGVPTSHHNDQQTKNELIQNLVGEYTVNGRKFEIATVDTMLQPMATFAKQVFHPSGDKNIEAINKYFANDYKTLIVDAGFETIDFLELLNGKIVRVAQLNGMGSVYNTILEKCIGQTSRLRALNLSVYQVEDQLRNGTIVGGPAISTEAATFKQDSFMAKAEEMYGQMAKDGFNFLSYNEILFTGGGNIALKSQLESFLNNDKRAIFVENSQMANAQGYLIKAKQITMQMYGNLQGAVN
ncbi:ParM/StbA family protein [Bacillus mycoides]|uniref:ParM/StbA family protein n=1 Tax=Bacillus mycoides TaxID=1405 RepID=UPI002E200B7A|nr:ParM/StbA family protein [Bacillus mycoides]